MATRGTKNNLLAGALLLGSLVAFIIVTLVLSDSFDKWKPRNTFVVRYRLSDGAMGIKPSSMVKVGGQPAGFVSAVSFRAPDGADESHVAADQPAAKPTADGSLAPQYVYVTIRLDRSIQIFTDAIVALEMPLLGSVSTINIPDVGGSSKSAERRVAGDAPAKPLGTMQVIQGQLAPPVFMAQVGYGDEQRNQLQQILRRGSEIGRQVQDLVASVSKEVTPTLEATRDTMENVRGMSRRLSTESESWWARIGAALLNVQETTEDAKLTVKDARTVVQMVSETIRRNQPRVDAILANTQDLTEKFNKELYGEVLATMQVGRQTMEHARSIADRVDKLLVEQTPEIRRMMADMRLSTDQLKLAMVEIRRNPWRLLYQPTRRELSEELTYDAARSYAAAVGDLRSAADALQAVTELATLGGGVGGPGPQPIPRVSDPEQIKRLTAELQARLAAVQEAERKLLDRITAPPGGR